jgi:hypothetical protein
LIRPQLVDWPRHNRRIGQAHASFWFSRAARIDGCLALQLLPLIAEMGNSFVLSY